MELKKSIKTNVTIPLSGDDIVNLLISAGHIPEGQKCSVSFETPGAGDWTNVSIDIDDENCIYVEYEERIIAM